MRLYDDDVGCWFSCRCTAVAFFGPGPESLGSVLNWILFFGLSYAMAGWLFRLFFNFVNSTI